LETLRQDLWYAMRLLLKRPGFTVAATLSLALGIGANAAIFSMLDAVVLRPLDLPDPDRLAVVWSVPHDHPDQQNNLSVPDFTAFKSQTDMFESFGVMTDTARDFGAEEDGTPAERIPGLQFTPAMFRTLGVSPLRGRVFTDDEDAIDAPAPVVIISEALWRRRFAGAENILDLVVRIDGQPYTIIGVMPAGFNVFDTRGEFWMPQPLSRVQLQGSGRYLLLVGRLARGHTLAQTQAALDAFSRQLATQIPADKGWQFQVQSMHDAMYGWMRSPLLLLQGIVGFVLLIACANVAGLLMARASSRQVEIAVRTALGAARGRIVRQLLTESVLLAALGGCGGVLFAWWGLRWLVGESPTWVPRLERVGLHPRALAFTLGLSVLTGLVFGVVPALRGSTPRLASALKAAGRGAGDSLSHDRFRGSLVALQIALSLVLLIGAALLITTFRHIEGANVGCDPQGVLVFDYRFPNAQMMKRVGSYNGFPLLEVSPQPPLAFARIVDQLHQMPGIHAAARISRRPLNGDAMALPFTIPGRPKPPVAPGGEDEFTASAFIVTPGYFETMKILVRGRDFTAHDVIGGHGVAIVNEAMVRRFWPTESPIGRTLTIDLVGDDIPREIVGVAGDVPLWRGQSTPPAMYLPSLQQEPHWRGPYGADRIGMSFVLHTAGNPVQLVPAIRRLLAQIDPNKPPTDVQTMDQYLGDQLDGQRQFTFLLSLFGLVATVLAATGIYSVIAYSVAQRTREIGIRRALGARGRDIARLVLQRAAILIGVGLLVGFGAAWALTRLIATQLVGVTATDPVTFLTAASMLAVIALLASAIPALRAVSIHPAVALRQE
jgi:putative ABC transport system permease protein